jgi:hypothetical protein
MLADVQDQPKAVRARYDRRMSRIIISLDSGLDLAFPPRLAQGLKNATAGELANIEISPVGDGLYWPAIDADLYIAALLQRVFGSKRWMASQMGASGERSRSLAKGNASRDNARQGGGPTQGADHQRSGLVPQPISRLKDPCQGSEADHQEQ